MTVAKRTKTEAEKEAGVMTRTNLKRRMGISGQEPTEEQEKEIESAMNRNMRIKTRNAETIKALQGVKAKKKSKVRRIDKKDTSSLLDLLQDAKERYVHNEQIIEELQAEIDAQPAMAVDNANGSMSAIPQLNVMEHYIKLNIQLRSQIISIEDQLDVDKQAEEANPFA